VEEMGGDVRGEERGEIGERGERGE